MKISDLVQNLPTFAKELNISIDFDEESLKRSQPYLSYTILMEKISSLFSSFHSHDEHYETLYILEGECQYKVDDKTYNIKKGDMAITFPNQMHQIISTTPSKRIVTMFVPKFLNRFNTEITNFDTVFNLMKEKEIFVISFSQNEMEKIENLLLRMCKTINSKNFGDDLQYTLSFFRVMLLISDHVLNKTNLNDKNYESNTIIKSTIEYINKNFKEKITIEGLAKEIAISPSYLSHVFKENTGVSVLQFIIKKRLSHAKKMLQEGKSIMEASIESGFKDYSSFFRSFKKEFLITPKDYIKSSSLSYID